jgi:hypothetical protein
MLFYVFFILLVRAEVEHIRSVGSKITKPPIEQGPHVGSSTPIPQPEGMTFFSVYCPTGQDQPEGKTVVCCKVGRAINNLEAKISILGSVSEDVVGTAGQILIPAGSKVIGQGFCDSERARVLGRGRWIFYVGEHQISIEGILLDDTKKEGLPGAESETGQDEGKIKQAIYRDGVYLYVPTGTKFVLKLSGNSSIRHLGSAADE